MNKCLFYKFQANVKALCQPEICVAFVSIVTSVSLPRAEDQSCASVEHVLS